MHNITHKKSTSLYPLIVSKSKIVLDTLNAAIQGKPTTNSVYVHDDQVTLFLSRVFLKTLTHFQLPCLILHIRYNTRNPLGSMLSMTIVQRQASLWKQSATFWFTTKMREKECEHYLESKGIWHRSKRCFLLDLDKDWIFVAPEKLIDRLGDEQILQIQNVRQWVWIEEYKLENGLQELVCGIIEENGIVVKIDKYLKDRRKNQMYYQWQFFFSSNTKQEVHKPSTIFPCYLGLISREWHCNILTRLVPPACECHWNNEKQQPVSVPLTSQGHAHHSD